MTRSDDAMPENQVRRGIVYTLYAAIPCKILGSDNHGESRDQGGLGRRLL